MFHHFRLLPFLAGLAVGAVVFFYLKPESKERVVKWPRPENCGKFTYRDRNGLCYVFESQIGKNFTFGDGTYFKQANDFCIFSEKNDLSIKTETVGVYDDLHNGYKSNKIVALTIYNKLIDLGLIDLTKIDINWKELKEFKIKPKLKKII
jgi:hypothetical protein